MFVGEPLLVALAAVQVPQADRASALFATSKSELGPSSEPVIAIKSCEDQPLTPKDTSILLPVDGGTSHRTLVQT